MILSARLQRVRLATVGLIGAALLLAVLASLALAVPGIAAAEDAGVSDVVAPEGPTGVDVAGPPIELDHEPELGEFDTTDVADTTVVTTLPAEAPVATAAGSEPVAAGSLPFTGASAWLAALLGGCSLALGFVARAAARLADERMSSGT
ncbi:MAG: hypothetical protein JWM86_1081 [Thermoleophilia bacterium]|nr:hypothetical protein [Thermoleophilia bacterium]